MKCNHQFWKDKNPATCLNCGKTEQELYRQEVLKMVLNSLPKEIEPWQEMNEEWRNGYSACWEECSTKIKKIITNLTNKIR